MTLFRCFNGNVGGVKLTAQYKVVISGASKADITILATGQTTTIQHRDASSQTFTVGGLKVRYQNSDPFYWVFTDANGLYLAWRKADSEEVGFTKEWDNTYNNTGTFYFCDSIKQLPQTTMTIPS